MKATEAKLLDFLKKSPQFVIPIYQRTYSWTEQECEQLWNDILRAGSSEKVKAHFVGSIVYVEKGLSNLTSQEPLLVIDGQQRLTTLTLLIAALAQALEKNEEAFREPVEGFSPRKLRNYYLVNPEEDGERHYKLLLTQTDKESLIALVTNGVQPAEPSVRVTENFALFTKLISTCKGDFGNVCRGLAKLVVVDIALNRDQDNPQLIFESMNSTGKELSQADLIRNFILMGIEPKLQTRLYEQYWRPMEVEFGQANYVEHFDAFMRHYLTFKTGDIPRQDEVYASFKQHAKTTAESGATVEVWVKDIRDFARYYCAMALGTETDTQLQAAFQDLRDLKVDVAYPFLLELYDDYKGELLTRADFEAAVRLIEAYVFRRAICSIPTNSLNKTFASLGKSLNKTRYLESLKAQLLLLPSYRRFPSDDEFERDIQLRDLYNFRSRSYWLRRFENFGRKERVPVDEYTIEHILPQNKNLPKEWIEELGPNWQKIQETWIHTLGNLTLTGYNSEYSDRGFAVKRDMDGGFKDSPLRVNQGLGQLTNWTEDSIKTRAAKLAKTAISVWAAPHMDPEVLETYRPKVTSPANPATYTLTDHPFLHSGPVRELFDAFRKEVLALDPCVTEEVLKHYIAFKAETNFADVVPQAKRLRITLNVAFHEIDDPRNLCRDVTGIGRWGNGDVKVSVTALEDLPYVMGLVRQSFEKQMGS